MYVERVIVLFMRLVIRTTRLERQGCDASLFVRREIISRNEYRKMLNVIISYDHYRNSSDLINSRDWSFIHRKWRVFLKADILGDLFRVWIETQRHWKYKLLFYYVLCIVNNCFLTVIIIIYADY